MTTASISEMQSHFSDFLAASQTSPVVVKRRGKPVAVLVAVESEADVERLALAQSRRLRQILAKGHEQIRQGKGIPHDEFWRQFGVEAKQEPRTMRGAKTPRPTKRKANARD